jgi:hypothetical protein
VPAGKDLFALGRGQAPEFPAGSAPGGGGVVADGLPVRIGGGVHAGDALFRCLGGLEFGKEGYFVGLAPQSAAGGGESAAGYRAECSAGVTVEFHRG